MAVDAEILKALLRKWRDCGSKVESAIAERDYVKCRKADSEGKALFAELIGIMDEGLEPFEKCGGEIRECVELWRGNVNAMPDWLAETKSELENVRKRLSTRRKIDGVYEKGLSQSGARVKIKAR